MTAKLSALSALPKQETAARLVQRGGPNDGPFRESMHHLMSGDLPAASMRVIEIGLAMGAIATAVLIGLLR